MKSGEARTFGVFLAGAKVAAGTNESTSQRPFVSFSTAVNAIAPSVSLGAGCSRSSTLISRG
ncbi:MAG: hypothetical protein ACJ744_05440 [Gaiellaceae bacterium]